MKEVLIGLKRQTSSFHICRGSQRLLNKTSHARLGESIKSFVLPRSNSCFLTYEKLKIRCSQGMRIEAMSLLGPNLRKEKKHLSKLPRVQCKPDSRSTQQSQPSSKPKSRAEIESFNASSSCQLVVTTLYVHQICYLSAICRQLSTPSTSQMRKAPKLAFVLGIHIVTDECSIY